MKKTLQIIIMLLLSFILLSCSAGRPLKMNGVHKLYGMDKDKPIYIKILDDKNLKILSSSKNMTDIQAIENLKSQPSKYYIHGKSSISIEMSQGKMHRYAQFRQNKDGSFQDSKFLEVVNNTIVNESVFNSINSIDVYTIDVYTIDGEKLEDAIFKNINGLQFTKDCRNIIIEKNFVSKTYSNTYNQATEKDYDTYVEEKKESDLYSSSDKYEKRARYLLDSPVYKILRTKYDIVNIFPPYGYTVRNYKSKRHLTGVANDKGELLLPLIYEELNFEAVNNSTFIAGEFYESDIKNYSFNSQGYILYDVKQKKIIFKADFLAPEDEFREYIMFKKGNNTGLLNNDGNIVLPLQNKYSIKNAYHGVIAYVDGKYKTGIMDFNFKKIVDDISRVEYKKDYFVAIDHGDSMFYNYKGKKIFEDGYQYNRNLNRSLLDVGKAHKRGVINIEGKQLIPFKYDKVHEECQLIMGFKD